MTTSQTTTVNFMGGTSYKLSPLQTLQIVCTSMICGESQYYRRCGSNVGDSRKFVNYFMFSQFYKFYNEDSANNYFDNIVTSALDHDFKGCLQFVCKLRTEYGMRLNSNYLLSKAIHHANRTEFNKSHPCVFKRAIEDVGCLPTDWTTQYKFLKESGKPIPTIWKRAIATKLQNMSAYHASKYLHGSKTKGKIESNSTKQRRAILVNCHMHTKPISELDAKLERENLANLVDLIRITHPKPSTTITELIKHGKVEVADDEQTWEKLRSAKKTWQEINEQIRLPHMALLRNLRNILEEYSHRTDINEAFEDIRALVERLVAGVRTGKQFPFRYFSAYKMLARTNLGEDEDEVVVSRKRKTRAFTEVPEAPSSNLERMTQIVLDGLNRCVLESIECIPPLKGRVDCLSDNSGSSRQGMVSEYGTVRVFEIANLSAILTAYRSTEGGSVWVFGDRLAEYPVSKDIPILQQLEEVNALGNTVGGGTETGVWLFWQKCILEHRHLDTVFIYSDMQAGTGGLIVDSPDIDKLKQMGAALDGGEFVDVLKLVEVYRDRVYSKANVFSVQVAGYDNSILPDIFYRGAVLAGWTGKEAKLAYEMTEIWDNIETVSAVDELEVSVDLEDAAN